jgi:hypothetical protein
MTVGGLVDTVFRFNRLCECHLYTAPRNNLSDNDRRIDGLPFYKLACWHPVKPAPLRGASEGLWA